MKGIWHDDLVMAYASRARIAIFWSGRCYPSYMEIKLDKSIALSRMPPEMKEEVLKC